MNSSWVWMMVLVALGSSLIQARSQVDVRKLPGAWFPLATARIIPLARPVFAYRIVPNNQGSFVLILPVDGKSRCNEVRYSVSAKKDGYKMAGSTTKIRFVETDYKTYHITALGDGPTMALILYAKVKILSDEMKARFQIQATKWGYKCNHINFKPNINPCPLSLY